MRPLRLLIPVFILLWSPAQSRAQTAALPQPKVCVGYDPELQKFGAVGVMGWGQEYGFCSRGYAFIGVHRIPGPYRSVAQVPAKGYCCPMPEDLLTGESTLEAASCPEQSVATGAIATDVLFFSLWTKRPIRHFYPLDIRTAEVYWRCTKINSARYRLGAPRPGIAWGWNHHFSGRFMERITKLQIPVSLRYAVGRTGKIHWNIEGCIGDPIGSLLWGRRNRRCHGLDFRELQFAGKQGDPASGTPVKIFDDCVTIDNRLSAHPRCIR